MADKALPILNIFMNIIGLEIMIMDNNMKVQIEQMIGERNNLRAEKKFQEADMLRKKILELFDVELTDHSNYTSWKKKEIIEYETSI
jgi:cysteinyl-tRNA synthetase